MDQQSNSIPPIFLLNQGDWKKHSSQLRQISNSLSARILGNSIKLCPKDEDAYRNLTRYLQENKVEFHTYSIKTIANTIKVVLRGLPIDTPPEDIQQELVSLNFKVKGVHQLSKNGNKMPLFLVICEIEKQDINNLYNVKDLLTYQIRVEGFQLRGPKINQCFKCQRFGHSSLHCYNKPRCVKCPSDHPEKDCKKQEADQPYCVNCEAYGHPANYRGCGSYRKILQARFQTNSPPTQPTYTSAVPPRNPSLKLNIFKAGRRERTPSVHNTPRTKSSVTSTARHNHYQQKPKNPWHYEPHHQPQPNSDRIFESAQRLKEEAQKNLPPLDNLPANIQDNIKSQFDYVVTYIRQLIEKLQIVLTILQDV